MADKGIIFSAPMVRALLHGRKTQTRRLLTPQPDCDHAAWPDEPTQMVVDEDGAHCAICGAGVEMAGNRKSGVKDIPIRYSPGDRLYVREAYTVRGIYSDVVEVGYRAHERASHTEFVEQWPVDTARDAKGKRPVVTWPSYKPSIHMPRWASRLWLEVTDVRVQRVAEISAGDCYAEGIERPTGPFLGSEVCARDNARNAFRSLWNSLHDKPSERWEDNPFVVAVSFTVHHGNIDRGGLR